eukprot:g1275.t1
MGGICSNPKSKYKIQTLEDYDGTVTFNESKALQGANKSWIGVPERKEQGTTGLKDHRKKKLKAHIPYMSLRAKDIDYVCPLGKGIMGQVWLAKVDFGKSAKKKKKSKKRKSKSRKVSADNGDETNTINDNVEVSGVQYHAVKRFPKVDIEANRSMKDVCYEVEILKKFRHPYLCYLFTAMQTPTSIILVLEYCAGGELFHKIQYSSRGCLSEEEARFYAVELVCVLSFLHENGVVYRDLKPDNVMIDYDGHVKLVDFGFARFVDSNGVCRSGRAGTSEYMAPELIDKEKNLDYGFPVDCWALGVLIFEMIKGKTPFDFDASDPPDPKLMIMRMTSGVFPKYPWGISPMCKDFISNLLIPNPKARLRLIAFTPEGPKSSAIPNNGIAIDHAWFQNIDKQAAANRGLVPPFIPDVTEIGDHKNFIDWPKLKYDDSKRPKDPSYCTLPADLVD